MAETPTNLDNLPLLEREKVQSALVIIHDTLAELADQLAVLRLRATVTLEYMDEPEGAHDG